MAHIGAFIGGNHVVVVVVVVVACETHVVVVCETHVVVVVCEMTSPVGWATIFVPLIFKTINQHVRKDCTHQKNAAVDYADHHPLL